MFGSSFAKLVAIRCNPVDIAIGSRKISTTITNYSKTELLIDISSKEKFNDSLLTNETLRNLRDAYQSGKFQARDAYKEEVTDELNSIRSLPRTIFPKDEIFQQVKNDEKIGNWRKPAMKWIRAGIHLMKYYRNGMQNSVKVFKDTKNLNGKFLDKSKMPMVTKLFHDIEMNEIEFSKLKSKSISAMIKPPVVTRKQFVEYYRRKEIWKLPMFFLIALVFEELTAVICYLFPRVVPYNCLTPSGFKHLSSLNIKNKNASYIPNSNLKYQSPYTLPKPIMYGLLKGKLSDTYASSLKLRISKLSDNKIIPAETLTTLYQHTFVDDWFVLRHILHSTDKTILSYEELVNLILFRKLHAPGEDLNRMVNNDKGRQILIWRLIIYWSFRFNNTISTQLNYPSKGEEPALFTQKWGITNIAVFNKPGTLNDKLINEQNLNIFK